jgi:non-ribosomal peptide synthase protein (TIGR01720 family)
MGSLISPEAEMKYLLDIRGMTVEGKLTLTFVYNRYMFQKPTIESLVRSFKSYLVKIIEHCIKKEETKRTASDFSASDLDEQEVENIFDELEEL